MRLHGEFEIVCGPTGSVTCDILTQTTLLWRAHRIIVLALAGSNKISPSSCNRMDTKIVDTRGRVFGSHKPSPWHHECQQRYGTDPQTPRFVAHLQGLPPRDVVV